MEARAKLSLIRYLPQVACATLLVAVCPLGIAWALRRAGVIDSVIASAAISIGLSLTASFVGRRLWSARPGARDLLFSELLVWGWLRRVWVERRLSKALRLLEHTRVGEEVGAERREQLLAQLAMVLEARDPYTHGHSRRVARHAATIARRLGLSREEVENVRAAAVLHDVGKMDTPNSVLHKADRLTDAEFDVIKQHPVHGAVMVSKIENDALTAMVRSHHERLDGSGYPDGIAGEDIPLGARIIAVADTFDAITSVRPYRPPRSHQAAIAILEEQAGTRLDPDAVRAFRHHYAGRRSLAAWVGLTNTPARIADWLGGGAVAASGSAARVVAASALSGAAAATAVVNINVAHVQKHTHAPSRAASSRSAVATSNWSGAAQPSSAGVLAMPIAGDVRSQGRPTRLSVSLVNRPSAPGALAAAPVIGAVGALAAPTLGSVSRGLGEVPVDGSSSAMASGLGGDGAGTGRTPGEIAGVPPADTQTTPPADTQTTPPADTLTTPPADTQTTPSADTQTPPVDSQTPPVDTSTPPADTPPADTPPVDSQTPPVDTTTPPADSQTPPPVDTSTPPAATPAPPPADPPPTTATGDVPASGTDSSS